MGYYQFIAVMDHRTTPMCQSLDGEIFPIIELSQGENAPPMHVRCRSTIAASEADGRQGRKPVGQRAARDEDGKRIKIPADMTYRDWKAVYIDKTRTLEDWRKATDAEYAAARGVQAGGITGALNPESPQANAYAIRYYGLVRSMRTDCRRIAKNTGFREEDIQRIKNHVFYEEHELYDGEIARFDPSYHMAQSWQRLIDGRSIQERDIILLNHEFLESVLMSEGLVSYIAHEKAQEVYNYAETLKDE